MRTLWPLSGAFVLWLFLAASFCTAQSDEPGQSKATANRTVPRNSSLDSMRLHTRGTELLNADGKTVHLFGVNIASLEWRNDGDHVKQSVNRAIEVWKVNLIRLPLAQDRWFGKMPDQKDGGGPYRAIVDDIVARCAAACVYVDLDLHWSDCGEWVNEGGRLGQHNMPDQNSVAFWHDVAIRYRNFPNVIFGLYNEPHHASWDIWRNGGMVEDIPPHRAHDQTRTKYQSVGMQKLYDTVRAAGAENLVAVSGLDWGYDLSGVLHGHAIAGTNVVYETHPYPMKKDWDRNFGEASGKFPVYVGEWGFGGKASEGRDGEAYGRKLMAYIKSHGISMWTAWDFHPSAGPALIKNWSYEPTEFGKFVKKELAAEAAAHGSKIDP